MQEPELRDDQEQEDHTRPVGIQQVLSPLPQAHWSQRDEVRGLPIADCRLPIQKTFGFPNWQLAIGNRQ